MNINLALPHGKPRRPKLRKTKAEKESAQLWAWYVSDFDDADSFAAQERARESQRQQLLKQEIGAKLLAAEVEKAVSEMSDA